MATFLALTNRLLKRLNEVELTSVNFASAVGVQALSKDAINESIKDIHGAEDEWPFNYTAGSQSLTPGISLYTLPSTFTTIDWESFFLRQPDLVTNGSFTSNITSWTDVSTGTGSSAHTADGNGRLRLAGGASGVGAAEQELTTIANKQYELVVRTFSGSVTIRIGTTSGGTDVQADTTLTISANLGLGTWTRFVFTPTTTSSFVGFRNSANANYDIDIVEVRRADSSRKLDYCDFQVWQDKLKQDDIETFPDSFSKPSGVFRTQNDEFGVTPTPNEPYTITFDYWVEHAELSANTDTTTIPFRYDNVIVDGAVYYLYMFRDNFEMASTANKKFNDGKGLMRRRLINFPKQATAK